MSRQNFEMELEGMGLISIVDKVNISGSSIFFTKLLGNLRRIISENSFVKLTSERFENFLNMTTKEILVANDKFYMYRVSGKLFINKKNGNEWVAARIY